ncbi:MAG: DUF1800 family protein [Saprospiraceae bacterium]|nr:DUF1800 family protein [Lewinellaceae bacterium]
MASLTPLSGALGQRRAAHLLRRASFRFTKAKVDELAGMTASQAAANLLISPPLQMDQPVYDNPNSDPVENTTWLIPSGLTLPSDNNTLRRYVMAWWVNEALHDPGVTQKMVLFMHQHLIVTANASGNAQFFDYLRLLHWGAMGNFKKLATKMVTDNSMLVYLNNQQNTASNPNENFAREFFELFTIGKGPQIAPDDYTNYTEYDIEQAARVFTGFRTRNQRDMLDPETNIPRGNVVINQHDKGNKVFSDKFNGTVITGAQTGNAMWTELDAFVTMVFNQEATARTFCRRLYRWFVSRKITAEIENDIITPLATTFRISNYEIKPVLKQLLQSQHFFDADDSDNADEIIGGLIKSPLEISLQMLSFFNIPIPSPTADPTQHYQRLYSTGIIQRVLLPAGLPLFYPNDVAGYPGYYQEPEYSRQWFNSSTIIARYKFPRQLTTGRMSYGTSPNALLYFRLDIVPWVKNSGFFSDPLDPYALVQDILNYLLPEQIDNDRFNYFYLDVFLDNLPPADWTYEWQHYLDTGDDTEVRIPLEKLLNAIMYSPEFQTF